MVVLSLHVRKYVTTWLFEKMNASKTLRTIKFIYTICKNSITATATHPYIQIHQMIQISYFYVRLIL